MEAGVFRSQLVPRRGACVAEQLCPAPYNCDESMAGRSNPHQFDIDGGPVAGRGCRTWTKRTWNPATITNDWSIHRRSRPRIHSLPRLSRQHPRNHHRLRRRPQPTPPPTPCHPIRPPASVLLLRRRFSHLRSKPFHPAAAPRRLFASFTPRCSKRGHSASC